MKIMIMYHNKRSDFDSKMKKFDDETKAETFIQEKIRAGYVCHRYDYQSSYSLVESINKFTI